jgi:hypothetical protein
MKTLTLTHPWQTTVNIGRFLLLLLPGGTALFLLVWWLLRRQAKQAKA